MNEEFRHYYYNFGMTIVSIHETASSDISEYKPLIQEYIQEYFRKVMQIPCAFKVQVDYFESSKDNATVTSYIPTDDTVYKEFVIRCKLLITVHDNNRLKITNPSKYEYMRDNESQFLKKFVHIV